MVELELFENTNNIITCLKMATRTDEYTQKLIQSASKCPDKLPTLSVHNPKKSVLIEEKRTEENILEDKTKRETTIPKDAKMKFYGMSCPYYNSLISCLN
jgi:hypothetical protein